MKRKNAVSLTVFLILILSTLYIGSCKSPLSEPSSKGVRSIQPTSERSQAGILRFATFNIQNFGKSKMDKPAVVQTLVQIVRKYDLIAVQEVSDKTGQAPRQFLSKLNEAGDDYELLLSERTGKQPNDASSQEAYAYFYRRSRLRVEGVPALYDDSAHDQFQREPFVARFATLTGNFTFVVINIHTQPERAVEEIGALHDVVQWARTRYPGEDDFICVGDFNGSCSYATSAALDRLALRGASYVWIVPDDADTNLAVKQCAYDRIVTTVGTRGDFSGQWGVDRAFTDKTVSDHWPVWAEFYINRDGR